MLPYTRQSVPLVDELYKHVLREMNTGLEATHNDPDRVAKAGLDDATLVRNRGAGRPITRRRSGGAWEENRLLDGVTSGGRRNRADVAHATGSGRPCEGTGLDPSPFPRFSR